MLQPPKIAKISELKNRLSHYLRFVRRGEPVLVCDRDRVIARIEPVANAPSQGAAWLEDLEKRGVVRRPARKRSTTWLEGRPRSKVDLVRAVLDEREGGR